MGDLVAKNMCSDQTPRILILAPLLATQVTWCQISNLWALALHQQNAGNKELPDNRVWKINQGNACKLFKTPLGA